jgi:sulfatase modifying factor 1
MPRSMSTVILVLTAACGSAFAQPGADGYDWAQIGAVGNAPYTGFSDPLSPTFGRGGVGYAYSMSRTEVTTQQWLDFLNAANARPDPLQLADPTWISTPVFWGGTRDTSYTGPGIRYRLRTDIANAGMVPASGVSWRECALLCNWLNGGRGSAAASFMNGAYDVSTFTGNFPTFTDQRQHTPGAHYWIPTLDEYMKAAFFDPNGNGAGQARWWQYPDRSNTPLIYGPPPSFGGDGTGQANAGFTLTGHLENQIPLGSYPTVQSPWGLLDVAGGSGEWIEDVWGNSTELYRMLDGSWRGFSSGNDLDLLTAWGSASPGLQNVDFGFRLASDVPAPGVGFTMVAGSCVLLASRQRRR